MPTVQPINKDSDNDAEDDSKSSALDDGPPSAPKKPAKKTSLYSSVGQQLNQEGQNGLASEGGSQPALAMMGMASIQRGVQILSAVLPGVAPVLSDLVGRLQMIIPQAIDDLSNGGMGLMAGAGMPQQPPMGGPPQMGPPPGPMGPPAGPPGAGPQPQQPPMPPPPVR